MPRALVTGASGFIGSALSSALLDAGWELATLQRTVAAPVHPRRTDFSADLLHMKALSDTLNTIPPVDAIVHLAALIPARESHATGADYLVANGAATAMVLEWGRRHDTPSFVYASSTAVLGTPSEFPITETHPTRPVNPYAVGKLAGEEYCEQVRRTSTMRTVSLRISSPYGSGMPQTSVLPAFARQALQGGTLAYYGSGAREQVFVHVRDVVSAIILAINGSAAGVFNVMGAEPIGMKRLAETIVRLSGNRTAIVVSAGVPDPQEEVRWPVSLEKSARELGYRPGISLEEGLKQYLAAF